MIVKVLQNTAVAPHVGETRAATGPDGVVFVLSKRAVNAFGHRSRSLDSLIICVLFGEDAEEDQGLADHRFTGQGDAFSSSTRWPRPRYLWSRFRHHDVACMEHR